MSKDKYSSIFSPQMEAFVFIILQIFFLSGHSFENWGMYKQQPPFGVKICQDICPQVYIICSDQQTVFQERSSRKTVSYEEQIMSKDKYMYPSIFSPQMEAIVFNILQIFFSQHTQFSTRSLVILSLHIQLGLME